MEYNGLLYVLGRINLFGHLNSSLYIVDIAGGLPTILCEMDPCDMSVKKSYIYANSQILAGYDGDSASRYFYLHDRLGSVRLIINSNSTVRNSYTYTPFGEMLPTECNEQVYNPFKFTGQWYDSEIGQYYLRARMYDPQLMRFTSIDPVRGKFQEPLTLHQYLYCINNPINYTDPKGEFFAEMYAWAADAAASVGAMKTAKESIINSFAVFNGVTSACMNVLFGPSDASDSAKAMIGFAAGFSEVQIGMRIGSASLGAVMASAFTSAANAAVSKNTEFLTWGTALNVGLSAAVGAVSDVYMSDLDATNAVVWWLVGIDAAMWGGVGQSAYDNLIR